MTDSRAETFIGRRVTRLEDGPLVTGQGLFAADIAFDHQLHMRIVRADRAHGRIVSIDTSAALAAPGVSAVWTAAEVADIGPIAFRPTRVTGLEPYRQPILASGRVRYVGEPVAAVFADDPYRSEDAAELVVAEIDDLPPVLAADAAPGPFDEGRDTEAHVLRKSRGEIEPAFAAAHAVVELDLEIGRHSAVPMETRGALARFDAARDVLELHGATKRPHFNRDQLARALGRSPSSVQLYESHIGGGFGVRGELYPEDYLVCLAALRLGRPVKWIEDRWENLQAANQSRGQRHRIRAAVDADGRLRGIEDRFWHDQGAYIRTHGVRVPDMTAGMLTGPYRVPAYAVTGHVRLTNKTPCATYRAPGRYEGTFVRERLMDAIADRLGLDPVALRRRNLLDSADMPYGLGIDTIDHEVIYDSGDYALLLDKALEHADWEALQESLAGRRAAGELVGAGLGLFVEKSAPGPADGVRLRVDATGAVELVTGGAALGQGFATAMAQICGHTLGVDYRRVRVVHGRTDRIDYGGGAHSSRATVMIGEATRIGAAKLRARAIEVAAALMQAPAESLDVVDGEVVRADGSASMPLAEIARTLVPSSGLVGDTGPGLHAEGWFRTDLMVYPYGVHIAVVRVDPATGAVAIERFVIAYDVGRAVNPMMVEGQLHGGCVQGIGGALYEEFAYDAAGAPLSVTFADYLLPGLSETPAIETLLTEDAPSPLNGLGVKGAGEGGINAVGAAVAAAIDAAIGVPGAIRRLPVTPERLMTILKRAGKA